MSTRGKKANFFKVQRFQSEMVDYLFSLGLSSSEIMVLDTMLILGVETHNQVAEKLFVSHKTIKFHMGTIYKIFQIEGNRTVYKKVTLILKIKDILEKNGWKLNP